MKEGLDGRELKLGWIRAEGTPRPTSEGTGGRRLSVQVTHPTRGTAEGMSTLAGRGSWSRAASAGDLLDLLPPSLQGWSSWLHHKHRSQPGLPSLAGLPSIPAVPTELVTRDSVSPAALGCWRCPTALLCLTNRAADPNEKHLLPSANATDDV